jgi:uncharacterized protein
MSKPVWLAVLCALAFFAPARAAEVLPPAPDRYFNDYAHVISPAVAAGLNTDLENLEKTSSNQILVAIYPKMESESSVEDFCHRTFATWHVGQKGKDNGAVLFIFVQDHKMWIEVNYGLEGALPDATCKDIVSDVIAPRFKAGDFNGGASAGVQAMIQATQGEYKGSGRTAHQNRSANNGGGFPVGLIVLIIIMVILIAGRRRNGVMYGGGPPIFFGGFGGGGGGFGGGGGGFSGGGGGGFSSGGGASGGGGGAGGGW